MRALLTVIAVLLSPGSPALPLDDLKLPPGFEIRVYARVENARQMALGDAGTVFVGSSSAGRVHALVDSDRDGVSDRPYRRTLVHR